MSARIERRRTSQQWTMRQATLACSSKVFARSNEKKDRSESHEAWDHLLMSPDIVSLVSTDQNWWNQWIEVSVQGDREPVSLSAAPFYFLNLMTMAGCRWKKSNERDREKKMHGPLLILAFLSRGWGGGGGLERQEETSQSSAWQKCVWLDSVRSWRRKKKSFALRVLLSGWNSPPQKLNDRSHQTWIFALWRAPVLSKLKKAGKSEVCLAEEERQNFLAAALFPRKLCRSAA